MAVVIAATNLDPNFRWAIKYGKNKTVLITLCEIMKTD